MYMPKIKDKSALIISILIPIAIGALSALFSNNMSSYATLVKPPLSPPSFILCGQYFLYLWVFHHIQFINQRTATETKLYLYMVCN